jgi:hypothetical protein
MTMMGRDNARVGDMRKADFPYLRGPKEGISGAAIPTSLQDNGRMRAHKVASQKPTLKLQSICLEGL